MELCLTIMSRFITTGANMSIWNDLQQGKKPWRPNLTRRDVLRRLLFSVPFLLFGCALLYCTSTCTVTLQRDSSGEARALVTKHYLGIPFLWARLNDVKDVRIDTDMRTIEKIDFAGSSSGPQSLQDVLVSKIVLVGGNHGREEVAVSEYRFYADAENFNAARTISDYLRSGQTKSIACSIEYAGSPIPPFLSMLFLFGLGGLIFISIPIDVFVWWIQRRYAKRCQPMGSEFARC